MEVNIKRMDVFDILGSESSIRTDSQVKVQPTANISQWIRRRTRNQLASLAIFHMHLLQKMFK
jgi:hypothetical protein